MAVSTAALRRKSDSPPNRHKLPPGSEDVQAVFDKYDEDWSGEIDKKELMGALRDLGVKGIKKTLIDKVMVHFGGEDAAGLNVDQFDTLVQAMRKEEKRLIEKRKELELQHYGKDILPGQEAVRKVYTDARCVNFVALVICLNFVINICEKEFDPDGNSPALWQVLDAVCNAIFLVELIANMYCYGGPRPAFWKNGWNVFDFIIVSVSVTVAIIIAAGIDMGPLKMLSTLRAFRIFRLFRRIKSFNRILVALVKCIPGVLNAFTIMLIVYCIYAMVAVDLFRDFGSSGTYTTCDDEDCQVVANAMTTRGLTYGFEYYGTFSKAMYTLFQVMTGESWSEAVARPLLFGLHNKNAVVATVFFVSFVIVVQLVLVNVVMAVLLENFVVPDGNDEPDIDLDDLLNGAEPKVDMATLAEGGAGAGEATVDMTAMSPSVVSDAPATAASGSGLSVSQALPRPSGGKVVPKAVPALALPKTTDGKLDLLIKQMQEQQAELAALKYKVESHFSPGLAA